MRICTLHNGRHCFVQRMRPDAPLDSCILKTNQSRVTATNKSDPFAYGDYTLIMTMSTCALVGLMRQRRRQLKLRPLNLRGCHGPGLVIVIACYSNAYKIHSDRFCVLCRRKISAHGSATQQNIWSKTRFECELRCEQKSGIQRPKTYNELSLNGGLDDWAIVSA